MEDKIDNSDEIIDLVDENDKVIGEITKEKANSNPKFIHREIAILIYTQDKKVLLQKRSFKEDVNPRKWDVSAAGHIPKGMPPIKLAHLKLKEELGFDTDLRFIYKKILTFPNETHFSYFYLGKLPENIEIKPNKQKIEEVRLFSKQDLENLLKGDEEVISYSLEDVRSFWRGDFDRFLV